VLAPADHYRLELFFLRPSDNLQKHTSRSGAERIHRRGGRVVRRKFLHSAGATGDQELARWCRTAFMSPNLLVAALISKCGANPSSTCADARPSSGPRELSHAPPGLRRPGPNGVFGRGLGGSGSPARLVMWDPGGRFHNPGRVSFRWLFPMPVRDQAQPCLGCRCSHPGRAAILVGEAGYFAITWRR